jgi:hypothetical protein
MIGAMAGFSKTQNYAIQVTPGPSNYYILTNNNTVGNQSGGILDQGSGANKIVNNNL